MANFDIAIPKILQHEGGYFNHPLDSGGETMYGITIKVARANGYDGPMVEMKLDFAKSIYKKQYWDVLNLDEVNNQEIANRIFDISVNCGYRTAAKILQRGLNLLNRNALSWFDIIVDGLVGKKTLGMLNELSLKDQDYMVSVIKGLQFERYVKIVEKNPTQEVFFRGWINRIK